MSSDICSKSTCLTRRNEAKLIFFRARDTRGFARGKQNIRNEDIVCIKSKESKLDWSCKQTKNQLKKVVEKAMNAAKWEKLNRDYSSLRNV